ncbi:hypothetical protein FPQ18DRAFT_358094, partial [Pyronema domesticum]
MPVTELFTRLDSIARHQQSFAKLVQNEFESLNKEIDDMRKFMLECEVNRSANKRRQLRRLSNAVAPDNEDMRDARICVKGIKGEPAEKDNEVQDTQETGTTDQGTESTSSEGSVRLQIIRESLVVGGGSAEPENPQYVPATSPTPTPTPARELIENTVEQNAIVPSLDMKLGIDAILRCLGVPDKGPSSEATFAPAAPLPAMAGSAVHLSGPAPVAPMSVVKRRLKVSSEQPTVPDTAAFSLKASPPEAVAQEIITSAPSPKLSRAKLSAPDTIVLSPGEKASTTRSTISDTIIVTSSPKDSSAEDVTPDGSSVAPSSKTSPTKQNTSDTIFVKLHPSTAKNPSKPAFRKPQRAICSRGKRNGMQPTSRPNARKVVISDESDKPDVPGTMEDLYDSDTVILHPRMLKARQRPLKSFPTSRKGNNSMMDNEDDNTGNSDRNSEVPETHVLFAAETIKAIMQVKEEERAIWTLSRNSKKRRYPILVVTNAHNFYRASPMQSSEILDLFEFEALGVGIHSGRFEMETVQFPVFNHKCDDLYEYCGIYKFGQWRPVKVPEWKKFTNPVKQYWAKFIRTTDAGTAMLKDKDLKQSGLILSNDDVIRHFDTGKLRLSKTEIIFHTYDQDMYDEFVGVQEKKNQRFQLNIKRSAPSSTGSPGSAKRVRIEEQSAAAGSIIVGSPETRSLRLRHSASDVGHKVQSLSQKADRQKTIVVDSSSDEENGPEDSRIKKSGHAKEAPKHVTGFVNDEDLSVDGDEDLVNIQRRDPVQVTDLDEDD